MYDVIIIGGSYAGLSAAMALGRSLKKTLLIDDGKPCNRQTPHSYNFLTRDGQTPQEISTVAKEQVRKYESVTFHNGRAKIGTKTDNGFVIETYAEEVFQSKKLIFATGIKDEMLPIPGFSDCWGISVVHCPYCHGYEIRQQETAIFATGNIAFHLATLVRNLTDQLTILTNQEHDFRPEQLQKLEKHGIKINEKEMGEIKHEHGHLSEVVFKDGTSLTLDAMYTSVPFQQTSDIPMSLGCELTEEGHIAVDGFQKTTVSGIYACGDNASGMRSIANAISSGSLAGAMVNMGITNENF